MQEFQYSFPSIRGIQAGREYYISMCPLRLLPKLFLFDDDNLPPEMRSQRVLNKGRLPEIIRYLVGNANRYVFSAITASIDAEVKFAPVDEAAPGLSVMGTLYIPMTARLVINDGQHRRAAIEHALREVPGLCDESIPVVFFLDVGLQRSQQMFADLNRYAVRPTRSLAILYDHRDEWSSLSKSVIQQVSVFAGMTETERSSLSNRSTKLFTLSGIYSATHALLADVKTESLEDRTAMAIEYWMEVAKNIPDWMAAKNRKISAAELRRDYVHSHAIALSALGQVGCQLYKTPGSWKKKLARLVNLDWSKSNVATWEGRAMVGGRLQKSRNNVLLTSAAIKHFLKLPLSDDEAALEVPLQKSRRPLSRRKG